MHRSILFVALALAGGAVMAQAPAGVVKNPSQESNPNVSGGKAQAKGDMNAEVKGAKASAGTTATMGNKGMDMNGDGFVSRKEWDSYHGKSWGTLKPNDKGMVPWADVEAKMKGGPN